MNLTAQSLAAELLADLMTAEDQGFTIQKPLGSVEYSANEDGTPGKEQNPQARVDIETNAAAVRMLAERWPELKITYPQTVVSEKTVWTNGEPQHFTELRTDAVICVPELFVQVHSGASFRSLVQEEWRSQLTDLAEHITKRLRRHELRTARMFGPETDAGAAVFRVKEDTVESDIWRISLSQCGFYPLQWDGEICGMALLLAERLKETLAGDCGTMLETAVRRREEEKCCTVTVYYSFKQD